jgi:Bacteriophage clamp loader A subunit
MKIATLDGTIEVEEEKAYKTPSISPFDFVNAIHYSKEKLIVDDWAEKQYNAFIVNRSLSFGSDTVIPANEMNSRPHLQKRMQFDFLCEIIRPKKRFNKWIKAEKLDELSLVQKYYKYNVQKGLEALKILTHDQLQNIRQRMFTGGFDNDT